MGLKLFNVTKFKVFRLSWLRGSPAGNTICLFDAKTAKRDVFGFFARALKFSDLEICKLGDPSLSRSTRVRWPKWVVRDHSKTGRRCLTKFCNEIIKCNDSRTTTDQQKEKQLKILFLTKQVVVCFVDQEVPYGNEECRVHGETTQKDFIKVANFKERRSRPVYRRKKK